MAETAPINYRRRITYTVLILIFFMLLLFAVYIRSPLATVKTVRVKGAVDIAAALLIHDTGIQDGQNLFKVPTASAQQRLLADFPLLRSARIERNFLKQSVTIVVAERAVAGLLEANGGFYTVLADGMVLENNSAGIGVNKPILSTSQALSISLGSKLQNPGLLSICRQLPNIPSAQVAQLSELHVEPVNGRLSILAFTRDGFEIRMPISHIRASLTLYNEIRRKLALMHVGPGMIDLISNQNGVYKPYRK